MRRIFLILSLAFLLPAIGQAQHPAGAAISAAPVAHFSAAPIVMAAPRMAAAHPMIAARPVSHPSRVSTRITATPKTATHLAGWNHPTQHAANSVDPVYPNGYNVTDGYPVPGLGFDYPHYFATHPNAGRCRYNCAGGSFVVPFGDGGFYIPTPMYTYAEQPAEAQPAEATDAGEQAAQTEGPPEQNYPNYPNPPARVAPQPAPKQQSEYVFVRRDGTLIFAVAYSWINDRLQYVSEEGLRRTVPLNTIDMDATQQFNEQRGVPIRLPA
jgi:hypothetical protein